MEWLEITAKTVDDALTEALIKLETTSDNVDYEVIEKESSGFLGLFNKPAKIRVKIKYNPINNTKEFIYKVLKAMNVKAEVEFLYDEKSFSLDINLVGDDMGILIGKRGQTLDSLQYLVSLVLNKDSETYIKVKLDTENYRERRKETLENLAKNIAFKVKRTRKPVSLEPMNPYERRIIHSTLQNDKFVETHSEGEEPFRKVVITLKRNISSNKDYKSGNNRYARSSGYNRQLGSNYNRNKSSKQNHIED